MAGFTSQEEELLIDLVEKNPMLYDVQNKNYKNHKLRSIAWAGIAEAMGETKTGKLILFHLMSVQALILPRRSPHSIKIVAKFFSNFVRGVGKSVVVVGNRSEVKLRQWNLRCTVEVIFLWGQYPLFPHHIV